MAEETNFMPSPEGPKKEESLPKKPLSHWLILGASLLAIIIFIGIAYSQSMWPFGSFLPQLSTLPSSTLGPAPSYTQPPEEFMGSEEINQNEVPSDWQTYHNDAYRFEIKYPLNWQVENSSATTFKFSDPSIGINSECSLTITFGGSVSPKNETVNHYNELAQGERCSMTLDQILASYRIVQ